MLSNYLKVAWRQLRKYKTFSFVNIFGLALSMSVGLAVISVIQHAYSYDRFHPQPEKIYRIITEAQRKEGRSESYASAPYLVAKTLTEEYAQVELWTPLLLSLSGQARSENRILPDIRGMYTNSSFFEMFGFSLASGDPSKALEEPFSMVLTAESADKFFPNLDPLGKIVDMPGYGQFKITGVLAPFPGKSHLEFDVLGSLSTHLTLEQRPGSWNISNDWLNYYGGYHYVRLKERQNLTTAQLALEEIARINYAGLELESRDKGYRFELQSLDDITPGRILSQTNGPTIPNILLWFMSILALIIILAASFNYMNLTMARAMMRTKEMGVRKVLGASGKQVFRQILSESLLMALLALLMSYILFNAGRQMMNRGIGSELVNLMGEENGYSYFWFLLFAIGVGLLAGALPAMALSRISPLLILRKIQSVRFLRSVNVRKGLLVFQSSITLIFIFALIVLQRQVDFALEHNFGFDRSQTLLVEMQGQSYDKLQSTFSQVNGVVQTSAISHPMGTYADWSVDVRSDSVLDKTSVRTYFIDHAYLSHFGLKLLAGENFPKEQNKELFALVNESFCARFGLGSPLEAVGKIVTLEDSLMLIVKGVLQDFPFKPVDYAMEPLILRSDPERFSVLNLELEGEILAVMVSLEKTWKQVEPLLPFQAEFFEHRVRENYEFLRGLSWVAGFFGLLGMVIACLGLLGLAMYGVESRAKEISIRKILGASTSRLTLFLSRSYIGVFLFAIVISIPLAWLLGNLLLQEFAQRISLNVWLFLPGILILALVAGITVGSQTIRAALSNPVKPLRAD